MENILLEHCWTCKVEQFNEDNANRETDLHTGCELNHYNHATNQTQLGEGKQIPTALSQGTELLTMC